MGLIAKPIGKAVVEKVIDETPPREGNTVVSVASKKALRAKRKAEQEAKNHKPMSRMGDTSYREVNDSFSNSSQMGGERKFMGEVAEGLGGNRVLGEADWRRRSREVQKWAE